MKTQQLSKRDDAVLKGTGIFLIFMHNYIHWQPGMGIENEFRFDSANVQTFIHYSFVGINEFIQYGFAYLGHFGVQLFVLTSGYGLYASTQAKGGIKRYGNFLIPKLIKITSLLTVGIAALYVIQYLNWGQSYNYKVFFIILLGRMTTAWNFSFDTIFSYAGPFWFFGLIVQLYALFPLLWRLVARWTIRQNGFILAGCLGLNMALYPIALQFNVPLMGSFMGHLPVFLLGMIMARHAPRTSWPVLLASVMLFVLGQYYELFFTATFFAWAYLAMSLYFAIKDVGSGRLSILAKLLVPLGGISMAIFVLNGPLRTLSIFRDASGSLLPGKIFLFILLTILISIPMAFLYKAINKYLMYAYMSVGHIVSKSLNKT